MVACVLVWQRSCGPQPDGSGLITEPNGGLRALEVMRGFERMPTSFPGTLDSGPTPAYSVYEHKPITFLGRWQGRSSP